MLKKLLSSRVLHGCLFLAILTADGMVGGLFLKLVRFRALSGWEDEIDFDSLLFNWKGVHAAALVLVGIAMAAVLWGFWTGGFYRRFGWILACVFLANALYPWGLTFHYVRSFHFILLLGILMNAYAFLAAGFLRKTLGLVEGIEIKEKKMNAFKEIPVEEAQKILKSGQAVFVDVRDAPSYQSSHVPGAVHLTDTNVEDFVAKTDKSKPVVCYCYHGNTSQGAAAYLADQGFQEVYSVIGGFERWRQTEKIED